MSEREPITAELRELMGGVEPRVDEDGVVTAKYVTPEAWGEFVHRCDAIDAVHAGLERENAELRQRVAKLDNMGESMHEGRRITDELRKWGYGFCGDTHDVVNSIADHIDAEHEAQLNDAFETRNSDENLEADGWVRLPLDADGVPWHINDEFEIDEGIAHVNGIGDNRLFYIDNDGMQWTRADNKLHHHEPTVEDVLQKLLEQAVGYSDAHTTVALNTIAEYAKRLRLSGDAE